MKIKWFAVSLVFIVSVRTVFARESLLQKSFVKLYADSDNSFGFDFSHPFGEFRFSTCEENYNFGLTATSEKFLKNFPLTIKAGNLSSSGAISRLNNPFLSTSTSPFSSGISGVEGISASIPGFTSFSKPVSTFIQSGYTSRKSLVSALYTNCWYVPESQILAASLSAQFSLPKQVKLKTEVTSGYFPLEENKISSWFSTENTYYPSGSHLCSIYQISAETKKLYTSFLAGIYETPFGLNSGIFRTDNKVSTNHFIFSLSALYNPNYGKNTIVTSSNKRLESCLQGRFSIQYKIITGKTFPVIVRSGITSFCNLDLTQTEQTLKLGTGLQLIYPITALTLTLGTNAKMDTQNPAAEITLDSVSINLKNTWYFLLFTPGLNFSFSFNPSEDFSSISNSCRIGLSLIYSKLHKISGNAAFTLTQKDDEITGRKLAGTISSSFLWKNLTVCLKVTADVSF